MGRKQLAMGQIAILVCSIFLPACQKTRTISDVDANHLIDRIKMDALQNRVDRLENQTTRDYAAFRHGDTQWRWLTTDSLSVRVKAEILQANGNSPLVRVGIANPYAMTMSDCHIQIQWAEVGVDKAGIRGTWRHTIHKFPRAIAPGKSLIQDLSLSGIPADKLGIVTLTYFGCFRIGDT